MASSLSLCASAGVKCAVDGQLSSRQQDSISRLSLPSKATPKAAASSSLSTPLAPSVESRAVVARVAADPSVTDTSEKSSSRYHFVVANAKFMLDEEEHFQEQLKERLRWLKEQGREQDFWLVYEPAFLSSFPEIEKRLKRPAVALVSTDGTWMTFMKIRLDRVLMGEFDSDTKEDALEGKPVDVEFDQPQNWIAPYAKYQKDWWKPYVPQ